MCLINCLLIITILWLQCTVVFISTSCLSLKIDCACLKAKYWLDHICGVSLQEVGRQHWRNDNSVVVEGNISHRLFWRTNPLNCFSQNHLILFVTGGLFHIHKILELAIGPYPQPVNTQLAVHHFCYIYFLAHILPYFLLYNNKQACIFGITVDSESHSGLFSGDRKTFSYSGQLRTA